MNIKRPTLAQLAAAPSAFDWRARAGHVVRRSAPSLRQLISILSHGRLHYEQDSGYSGDWRQCVSTLPIGAWILASLTLLNRFIHLSRALYVGTSIALIAVACIQTTSFVLLARGLGVDTFGRLMILQAFADFAFQLIGLGSGEALIRKVARASKRFPSALGQALIVTLLSGVILVFGFAAIVRSFVPAVSIAYVLTYLAGELFGRRLADLAEHCFISRSKVAVANGVKIFVFSWKLCAVWIAVYGFSIDALSSWIVIQGISSALAGAICLAFVIGRLGSPSIALHREDFLFGVLLAAGQLGGTIQFSADRIVLAMVADPSVVAVYAAAMKAAQASLLPLTAILRNLFPHFFAEGAGGIGAAWRLAILNLPKFIVVGLLAGVVLLAGANFVALILGRGFDHSVFIVRLLSGWALCQGIQALFADVLTGSDRQALRTGLTVLGATGYVGIVAALAFAYGLNGLVVGIYLHQLLAIGMYSVVIWHLIVGQQPGSIEPKPR